MNGEAYLRLCALARRGRREGWEKWELTGYLAVERRKVGASAAEVRELLREIGLYEP